MLTFDVSLIILHHIFEAGYLTNPGVHGLSRLAGLTTPKDLPVSVSPALALKTCALYLHFLHECWGFELKSSSCVMTLHPQNHSRLYSQFLHL